MRPPRHACVAPLEPRRLLADVQFALDPAMSRIGLSLEADVDDVGSIDLSPQADGSDHANLAGNLTLSVTRKGVALRGEGLDAVTKPGPFAPGNAPADFAVTGKLKRLGVSLATAQAAVRGAVFDLFSTGREKLRGSWFQYRKGHLAITGGTMDYAVDSRFGDSDGSQDLAGLSAKSPKAKVRLSGEAGSRTITIPISIYVARDFDGGRADIRIKGKLVGHEVSAAAASFRATPIAVPGSVVTTSVTRPTDQDDGVLA